MLLSSRGRMARIGLVIALLLLVASVSAIVVLSSRWGDGTNALERTPFDSSSCPWLLGSWNRDFKASLDRNLDFQATSSKEKVRSVYSAAAGARGGVEFSSDGTGREWIAFGGEYVLSPFNWRFVGLQGDQVTVWTWEARGRRVYRRFQMLPDGALLEECEPDADVVYRRMR